MALRNQGVKKEKSCLPGVTKNLPPLLTRMF